MPDPVLDLTKEMEADMADKPIVIPETLQAIIVAAVNRLVILAGAYLIGHGWATQEVIDQAALPVSQLLVGIVISGLGIAWGLIRAKKSNDQKKVMEPFVPDPIATTAAKQKEQIQ